MLKWTRRFLAAVSWAALTLLFLDFTGTTAKYCSWLAKLQVVPAALALSACSLAVLLVLTILFGRVYCTVLCPLGILQDFVRWATFGAWRPSVRGNWERNGRRWTRLGFLGVFLGGGFLGLHFAWLDPYAIYGRFASVCLSPLYRMGNNALAARAAETGGDLFYAVPVVVPATGFLLAASGLVSLVAALAVWRGRTWCNAACPVGTVLGAISRFAVYRPVIDPATCVKCRRCERICRTGSIRLETHAIDRSTCVACLDCISVCPRRAISWTAARPEKTEEKT